MASAGRPRGLGDAWVEVVRHVLDGRLWVVHEGRMLYVPKNTGLNEYSFACRCLHGGRGPRCFS